MIESLRIQNFKSIKHLELKCRRINIFIGKPNVGKSNILESLGIFSFGAYGGDLRNFVRFENTSNLFYDNDVNREIKISADDMEFSMKFNDGKFTGEYREKDEKLAWIDYDYEGHGIENRSSFGSKLKLFKFYRFEKLNSFGGKNPEFLLPPRGENLLTILLTKKELKSLISDIFRPYGLRIVLKPQENKIEIVKLLEDILISYPYSVISDTLQRVVFYLAAIESNKNSVIAFEEPESHAFPYYTKFLAERMARDESNQYFISTHNPYLLLSLLEKTAMDEIGVFVTYFENYQTKAKSLRKREIEEVMELDADVFFNLDRLMEE